MSGWYEWRDEGGPRKAKYQFQAADGSEIYMAGIWYPAQADEVTPALVTLTTQPDELCAQYHNRMPLLISPDEISFWLHEGTRNDFLPQLSQFEFPLQITKLN